MAAVVGEASAVAGLVSLTIQLFDGCVKGFVLLSAAQEFGSKGDVLRCQLEWEHLRLNLWARTVGLFQNPPELNVSYPPIVQSTLMNLEQLLTNASKLRSDYGLDLTITDEELKEVQAPKRAFGRILDKVKPQFVNDTAKVYSRRNNIWHKVKWGSMDAAKLRTLLQDIGYFNDRLRGLLHPTDQILSKTDVDAVMRRVVIQAPDRAMLDSISGPLGTVDGAIAASARLRQKGFLLDLLHHPSPSSSGTSTPNSRSTLALPTRNSEHRKSSPAAGVRDLQMQRDPKLLVSNQAQLADTAFRQIARYDEKFVIVEWKDVDKGLESKLKHRIAKVASLLASMQDPTFHSLPCLGFLKDPQSGRYAYMFDPPSFAAHSVRSAVTSYSTPSPAFSMKSLDQLYSLPMMRPSLNHRLKIAKALAETVLQLHTAGWLHKCIRPDNVLCFVPNTKAWDSIDQQPLVYLSGYEYARADNPLETTEDPSTLRHARMYRHPLSLGQGRASFAKHFDLYSLGCVLLEIGMWAPLQTMLLSWLRQESGKVQDCPVQISAGSTLEPRDDAEFYLMLGEKQRLLGETGRGSVFAELKFNMGAAYAQNVARCLQASSQSVKIGADDEDFDDSLDIQENSLATLHQLLEAV
jgi:Prion-inhibition and propagation